MVDPWDDVGREARLPPNSARVPGVGLCAYRLIFLKLKSPLGHSKAEWWKLPEDWATETPNVSHVAEPKLAIVPEKPNE
eukprot:2186359-Prymnesium_polylepis.1